MSQVKVQETREYCMCFRFWDTVKGSALYGNRSRSNIVGVFRLRKRSHCVWNCDDLHNWGKNRQLPKAIYSEVSEYRGVML